MAEEVKKEDLKEGFRVGDYFVTFPPGEFIHENDKGEMFIDIDVYKMDKDRLYKVNSQLTPEVEQMINEEINRMLTMAIDSFEKEKRDDNVKD